MKTIINVRTEPAIKKAAQRAAKELGVSLSTVVNASLREFVRNPRIELAPLVPNARTARMLDAILKEKRRRTYRSADALFADLDA